MVEYPALAALVGGSSAYQAQLAQRLRAEASVVGDVVVDPSGDQVKRKMADVDQKYVRVTGFSGLTGVLRSSARQPVGDPCQRVLCVTGLWNWRHRTPDPAFLVCSNGWPSNVSSWQGRLEGAARLPGPTPLLRSVECLVTTVTVGDPVSESRAIN